MRLNEKMGIPDGIHKQASVLYDQFIRDLKKSSIDIPYNEDEDSVNDIGEYDIVINDLKMDKLPFKLILSNIIFLLVINLLLLIFIINSIILSILSFLLDKS